MIKEISNLHWVKYRNFAYFLVVEITSKATQKSDISKNHIKENYCIFWEFSDQNFSNIVEARNFFKLLKWTIVKPTYKKDSGTGKENLTWHYPP